MQVRLSPPGSRSRTHKARVYTRPEPTCLTPVIAHSPLSLPLTQSSDESILAVTEPFDLDFEGVSAYPAYSLPIGDQDLDDSFIIEKFRADPYLSLSDSIKARDLCLKSLLTTAPATTSPAVSPALPPHQLSMNGTLVLDLDYTCFHFGSEAPAGLIPVVYKVGDTLPESALNGHATCFRVDDCPDLSYYTPFYLTLRPGLIPFLQWASQRYEVVAYTASAQTYADIMINIIDPAGCLFHHRRYRQHCGAFGVTEKYQKHLDALDRPLDNTIAIDDNFVSFSNSLPNLIPCKPFRPPTEDTLFYPDTRYSGLNDHFFDDLFQILECRDSATRLVEHVHEVCGYRQMFQDILRNICSAKAESELSQEVIYSSIKNMSAMPLLC